MSSPPPRRPSPRPASSQGRAGASETPSGAFVAPAEPPPAYEERPLPAGWIKEFDPRTSRHFFVDTLVEPARAIWVHPFDDPEFIQTHRQHDSDEELISDDSDGHSATSGHSGRHSPSHRPSSSLSGRLHKEHPSDVKQRPDSDKNHLQVPGTSTAGASSSSASTSGSDKGKKRGFFGKLKDKAIGTKEEREAARAKAEARRKEEERLYAERRDAMLARRMQEMEAERAAYDRAGIPWDGGRYGGGFGGGYPGNGPWRDQSRYGPPMMNAYGGPTYQDPYMYGQSPYGNRGGGGMGLGAPLIGGLVGGLLLGDILGGGF